MVACERRRERRGSPRQEVAINPLASVPQVLPQAHRLFAPRRHDAAANFFCRAVLFSVSLCLCGVFLPGCAKKAPPKPTVTSVVYTVRGEVARLPSPTDPASEFMVRHEEIPDFRASLPDGPLGMKPMIMPFTLGPGVSLEGLHIGDKITVRFSVDYGIPDGRLKESRVLALTPLPKDTRLDFSVRGAEPAAVPPASPPAPAPAPSPPPATPPAPGG